MKLTDLTVKIFGYNGPPADAGFTLDEADEEDLLAADGDIKGDYATSQNLSSKADKTKRKSRRPGKTDKAKNEWEVWVDLTQNKERIEALFHLPLNKDVVIREFALATEPKKKAFLVFMDGMVDKQVINNSILKPLMLLTNLDPGQGTEMNIYKLVVESCLPSNQVKELTDFREVVTEITAGSTAIFIDGYSSCIVAETKGFEHRGVDTARTEQVVQGPQEGFVENLRSNTSLIRKIIHSENLITEFLPVGTRNKTNVALMYLMDLANPRLVKEVKRRISSIKADYVPETGMLEEFIEDHPFSLIPQTIKTERPDRVASLLVEGKVAILVDNNPFVMIVPATFFHFLHTPEDYYVRFPYGLWLRVIRVAASIVSPILIIIVAVTGLASYAIPNYTVSFGFRSMRFIFIFLGGTLGFFGISTGLFVLLCLIISMKSFGTPYFAPVAPRTGPSTDLIVRQPMWSQELRPDYLQPSEVRRQPNFSRGWVKENLKEGRPERGGKGGNDD